MQPIGFLDLAFIVVMVGLNATVFWKFFYPKKKKKDTLPVKLDSQLRLYIESLQKGGSLKEYAKQKRILESKERGL